MATISLRAYNHEIEEMIAHNQFDQAIAHCRNILKSYPKHIDTYKLLGKAFLENQRYGDAGDIFQRVLSSFPEDFISHVGMSIIREDEGNLDDALWHMERAFELQPSNNAVQGELRRLHGKREGVEPSKIRLTRGALAHMYIRGDLFPQAIAELKIALTEDPTRFDLQTSLAKAYYLSGQLAEAAKISNEIINKLPYSFEANRILAEIYKKSDRKEEAQPFLEKLFELDPYFAYVTDNIPTPEQVNESAVTLEKLEWQPGTPMPVTSSQPEWAASIGISIENQIPKEENIPDWLLGSQEESKKQDQEKEPIFSTPEIPEKESEAPIDWSAPEPSIEPTTGEVESPIESIQTSNVFLSQEKEMESEGTQEFSEEKGISDIGTEMEGPEEIAPTEIPDWLRSLAPDQSKEPEETQMETPSIVSSSEKEYSWLDEINPEEGNPEEPFIDKEPFVTSGEESEQVPNWLQQMGEEAAISEEEFVEPESEFLSQALTSEEFEEPTESEPKDDFSWLSEPEAGQPERESLEEGSIWLEKSEEESLPDASNEEEIEPAVEVELPEWLSKMKEDMENHISEPKPDQEIPDWINRIEEPPVSEEDTKPSRLLQNLQQIPPTSPSETIPEITTSEPTGIPEETPFSAIFTEESFEFKEEAQEIDNVVFEETVEEESQLDWISKLPTELPSNEPLEAEMEEQEEPIQAEVPVEHLEESPQIESSQKEPDIVEKVEIPDWLSQVSEGTTQTAEPAPEAKPEWLSEMTPGQATEEEITAEAKPEWLSEVSDEYTQKPEAREKEEPEWLTSTPSEEPLKPETAPEEKPEWLSEIESKPQVFEETSASVQSVEPVFESPEMPFEEEKQVEGEEEPSTQTISEEALSEEVTQPSIEVLPDWLQEYNIEEPPVEEPIQTVSEEQPLPEKPAWFDQPEKLSTLDLSFSEEAQVQEIQTTPEPSPEIPSTPVEEMEIKAEIPPSEEFIQEIRPGIEPEEVAQEPVAEAEAAEIQEEAQPEVESMEYPTEAQIVPLDLNYASLVELERLPGVGFIKAQSIVNYRNEYGMFNVIDDLINVPGFDEELIQELKTRLEVVPPEEELAEIEAEETSPLMSARLNLQQGNITAALNQYLELIYAKSDLNDIANDLQGAIDRYPTETDLWQTLGDVNLRLGKLQDALSAYTEAEKLLR